MRSLSVSLFFVTLSFFNLSESLAAAAKHTVDLGASESQVEFLAVGRPSALKIRGKTNTEKVKTPLQGKLVIQDRKVSGD